MSNIDWDERKPTEYSGAKWRTWLEEKYPLGDSTLGSPLYQFLSDEVKVGKLGLALGDYLTHSESQRRKKHFPAILHYWSGKVTPWYPANEMTPPAPRSRKNPALAKVTAGLESYKRKHEQMHAETPSKRRKLETDEEQLEELTARNTKLNSSAYIHSADLTSLPVEDIHSTQRNLFFQQPGKDQELNPALNRKGSSSTPLSGVWHEDITVGQPPKVLKSAMRKTSGNSAWMRSSLNPKQQGASPPVMLLSPKKSRKRHLLEVHFERLNKRRTIDDIEASCGRLAGMSKPMQEKTTRSAMLVGPSAKMTISMPVAPIWEAPMIPRTGQARRALTIQTGLVPTLLMQATTLHTAPRKGFPMDDDEPIDGDDFIDEASDGSLVENRVDHHFTSTSYPTAPIEEESKQAVPTGAQAELPSPTSALNNDGDDEGDDDYERAFKEAWDEAIMPPPPRPASRPMTPMDQMQSSRGTIEQSNAAQNLIREPTGGTTIALKQPQAENIGATDASMHPSSATSDQVDQPPAELPTEAASKAESIPDTHVSLRLPLTIQGANAGEATEVRSSLQASGSIRRKVRRRRQAKEPAQKRDLRMSTMAQRRQGVTKLPSGASQSVKKAWRGLANDRTEAKMNDKGFLI